MIKDFLHFRSDGPPGSARKPIVILLAESPTALPPGKTLAPDWAKFAWEVGNATLDVGTNVPAEANIAMSGIDALMNAADSALYQAKAAGRNKCIDWSPPPPPRMAAE